jgi:hypothetical protein
MYANDTVAGSGPAKPAAAAKVKPAATTSTAAAPAKPAAPATVVAAAALPATAAAHPAPAAPVHTAASTAAPSEGPPAAAKEAAAAPERVQAGPALPGTAAVASDKPSDKDIAREAWRRNLPDISSSEETKASILIPIKGSIEGATYHVSTKPKSVVVNLPKADALITMRFYKIKREGFRNLWILKQEEGEGTTVKLMLGEATAPQVEIKDDYVRINVRKPADLAPEE